MSETLSHKQNRAKYRDVQVFIKTLGDFCICLFIFTGFIFREHQTFTKLNGWFIVHIFSIRFKDVSASLKLLPDLACVCL